MKRIYFALILTLVFATFAAQAVEQTAFKGAGVIESTSGGFKFPDGSVQLSAITPPCTAITYLPYTIIYEGVYCFTESLETNMASGNAIVINVDNVIIDLNGWMLDGLGAGAGTTTRGIYAGQRKNITIRNGTIRGFKMGLYFYDTSPYIISQGHLVEDIRAVANTYAAFYVFGSESTFRRNRVFNTGDTTGFAFGFYLGGSGLRVLNNDVSNTTVNSSGNAFGIYVGSTEGGVIEGNRINDLSSVTGNAFGIYISGGSVLVDHNYIENAVNGITFSGATGKYRDNLTVNVTTPFSGGTDAGGND